jgi:hypothetical protein
MNPFRNPAQSPADAPPLVYYILPQEEPPIGPGDLEIEFEFDPDLDEDDE